MALSPGTLLDTYEILGLLGSGGMGEVYRARDTKLGREVAIKALPDVFANNADRVGRFQREAQVLASLNHPNIAVIHELKEVSGARYLILELVEGETLGEHIGRGPLPVDEALAIARQIAEALESAHDRGIVHRDLKPANVKVTSDGHVKVLDFGLAKVHEASDSAPRVSRSPTLSAMNTAIGVILGTAAYMSPEQIRGKNVDRRADVWAFGCVLYEMLTGRKAFAHGDTVSDTLAVILQRDPDWNALPPSTPPRIRALLERCLRKDPARRIQDIGNARIELEEAHSESTATVAKAAAPAGRSRRREKQLAAAAAVLFVSTVALAAAFVFAPTSERPERRFEAVVPVNLAADGGFHVSPDGLRLAYVATQPSQIWVRALDSGNTEPIPSTEGVTGPNLFWSADSRNLGFFADGKLKRVAATGGPAQVIASLPAAGEYTGTWNNRDVILFASTSTPGGPLLRVPAGGGDVKPATEIDKTRKETAHRFPSFLPDGRHYLFLATTDDARERAAYIGDLDSADRRPLAGIAGEVKYSATGDLVFIRDGALMGQRFDGKRLELTGAPYSIADPFAPAGALTYPFSVSSTGTLAFRTRATSAGGLFGSSLLVWYDVKGARLNQATGDGEFRGPELSPDGKHVAFTRGTPGDIWVLDIQNARTDRLTSHAADDTNPRWSPDGKFVAFDSARDGVANLYRRAINAVGDDVLILKTETSKTLSDFTRDGRFLIYTADNDIWALPLTGTATKGQTEAKPIQITKTLFIETAPRVSPDGRWIAYASNEPGEYRVYLQSFPDPAFRQMVSIGGAIEPRWGRDSSTLYFYSGPVFPFTNSAGMVMAAAVDAKGSGLMVGAPLPRAPRSIPGTTIFSVAPDGRFLLQTIVGGGGRGLGGRPVGTNREYEVVTMIFNWPGQADR